MLNANVQEALEKDLIIDITTTGRKSGDARRVEIWFHNLDGILYITGLPGTRGWYANILVDPRMTFHLKETAVADLPALATPITDPHHPLHRRIPPKSTGSFMPSAPNRAPWTSSMTASLAPLSSR